MKKLNPLDVLKAKNNIFVKNSYAVLWGRKLSGGYEPAEATGTLPLTFRSNGTALLDYRIYGNTTQNGTPTPENPIIPIGCGELETTGAHAGQYKLPLTSAGQDVDIYLGEVETTRRIKKLVLTGEEAWYKSIRYTGSVFAYLSDVTPDAMPDSPIVCTHVSNGTNPYRYGNGCMDSNSLNLWLFDTNITMANFKSYLAAQYAAGTPVTVWYVLAEPETGIVNEPLMKIGDYADTISMEQTGVSIPTNKGSTTLDVDATIKPSNVYIKYKS